MDVTHGDTTAGAAPANPEVPHDAQNGAPNAGNNNAGNNNTSAGGDLEAQMLSQARPRSFGVVRFVGGALALILDILELLVQFIIGALLLVIRLMTCFAAPQNLSPTQIREAVPLVLFLTMAIVLVVIFLRGQF